MARRCVRGGGRVGGRGPYRGRGQRVPVTPGARVVDCRGLCMLPGLVDARPPARAGIHGEGDRGDEVPPPRRARRLHRGVPHAQPLARARHAGAPGRRAGGDPPRRRGAHAALCRDHARPEGARRTGRFRGAGSAGGRLLGRRTRRAGGCPHGGGHAPCGGRRQADRGPLRGGWEELLCGGCIHDGGILAVRTATSGHFVRERVATGGGATSSWRRRPAAATTCATSRPPRAWRWCAVPRPAAWR